MDPKTKETVNNIMNYVIGKGASDDIKKKSTKRDQGSCSVC